MWAVRRCCSGRTQPTRPVTERLPACLCTPSLSLFREHCQLQTTPSVSERKCSLCSQFVSVFAIRHFFLSQDYVRDWEWRRRTRLRSCSRSSPARCVWSCSATRWSSSADTTSARCASSSAGKPRRTSCRAARSAESRAGANWDPTRSCATSWTAWGEPGAWPRPRGSLCGTWRARWRSRSSGSEGPAWAAWRPPPGTGRAWVPVWICARSMRRSWSCTARTTSCPSVWCAACPGTTRPTMSSPLTRLLKTTRYSLTGRDQTHWPLISLDSFVINSFRLQWSQSPRTCSLFVSLFQKAYKSCSSGFRECPAPTCSLHSFTCSWKDPANFPKCQCTRSLLRKN